MNDFKLWFTTGVEHITDLGGYDHILFVWLLVLSFPLNNRKKLLILITGFTIGHSISLALSVTNIFKTPQNITEALIAFTILITAVYHIIHFNPDSNRDKQKNVFLPLFIITLFGGIHGMGFSYLLRSMLSHEKSIALPLIYFNIGIEAGQLLIVAIVLVFSLLLTSVLKCPFKTYKLTVSCLIVIISLKMFIERLLQLF